MAKICRKKSKMRREWKHFLVLSVLSDKLIYIFGGALIVTALFFIWGNLKNPLWMAAEAAGILLCITIHKLTENRAAVLKAGVSGEDKALRLVRLLPNSYTVINNVTVDYDDKSSELDMVVVGPTGVFVIETKNYTGTITGSAADTNWKRTKYTETGNAYPSTFYSPVKQVSTHTYRLSRILKQHRLYVWVQGIVYFSDSSAVLRIRDKDKKIPIFQKSVKGETRRSGLLHYIRTFPAKSTLSPRTVEKIVSVLNSL